MEQCLQLKSQSKYQLIGLGTYRLQDENCTQIIKSGLEMGYRLIDTAQLYHNHEQIALGISLSKISRTDIFITSKIHNSNIRKLKIAESIDQIKKELQTDYLDLLLLHNPVKNYEKAWEELIKCQVQMNIRYIGVSNFNIEELDKIINQTEICPWLNQIELSIFNQQHMLIEYHNSKQIITQAHSTLTKGSLLNDANINNFMNLIDSSMGPSEFMFKYAYDQDIGILPRTSNFEHLKLNWDLTTKSKIFDINFIDKNKDILDKLNIRYKIY